MKNEITAKRLQIALANANMKPQELADKSGVGKSSISQYVNGSHAPSNISSGKMGKVLNVNPLWLMGFDAPMKLEQKTSASIAKKDFEFFNKYSMLGERDKKIILDMINSMLSRKEELEENIHNEKDKHIWKIEGNNGRKASKARKDTPTQAEKDFNFCYKYSLLSERDKQIVMDMMDSMLSKTISGT